MPRPAAAIEPALEPATPLKAGIHLPEAEVGNCRQFALAAQGELQRAGVVFHLQHEVTRIDRAAPAALCTSAPCDNDADSSLEHAARRTRDGRAPTLRRCRGLRRQRHACAAAYSEAAAATDLRLFDHAAGAAPRGAIPTWGPARSDGRALQGRDHTPGRPRARGRQCRAGRRVDDLARGAAGHALPRAAGLVSERNAPGPGADLEGCAPDAARWPTGHRCERRAGRVDQCRPRLQRLGPGLRQRAHDGRPDGRPHLCGRPAAPFSPLRWR